MGVCKNKMTQQVTTESNVSLLAEELYKQKQSNKELMQELDAIKKENEKLISDLKKAIEERFAALSEAMRLRRLMECMDDEATAMKTRIADLERRTRNLELWERMNGIRKT